jgi:hypothetical protein
MVDLLLVPHCRFLTIFSERVVAVDYTTMAATRRTAAGPHTWLVAGPHVLTSLACAQPQNGFICIWASWHRLLRRSDLFTSLTAHCSSNSLQKSPDNKQSTLESTEREPQTLLQLAVVCAPVRQRRCKSTF